MSFLFNGKASRMPRNRNRNMLELAQDEMKNASEETETQSAVEVVESKEEDAGNEEAKPEEAEQEAEPETSEPDEQQEEVKPVASKGRKRRW
jgi:hypothetical protein